MIALERNELLRVLANYYYNLGLNVTCISNVKNEFNSEENNLIKSPNHPWKHLISQRQTIQEIQSYNWDKATGIGFFTGSYQKDNSIIAAIDIDGKENGRLSYSIIQEMLAALDLPDDYEWVIKSGSGNGYHIIFIPYGIKYYNSLFEEKVITLLPNFKNYIYFKRIEIRLQAHMVLPPSLHKSFNNYKFQQKNLPLNPPKMVHDHCIKLLTDTFCSETFYELPDDSEGFHSLLWDEKSIFKALLQNNGVGNIISQQPLFLVIDVETNGLPKSFDSSFKDHDNWPRIVELAWMLFDSRSNFILKKSLFIEPIDFEVNNEILELTNRNQRLSSSTEIDIHDALKDLEKWVNASTYIVGHNIEFDIMCLLAEYDRIKAISSINEKKCICTMKASVDYCHIDSKNGYKYPKLSELYEILFKSDPDISHNADADTYTTSKCFWELKRIGVINL